MPRPLQPDGRVHGVVVAVRRDDGRLLCIRRSYTVAAPGKVCFPGGAIEVGEEQHAAVIREMREELGIEARPLKQCWFWENPVTPLTLWGWTADWLSGELQPAPAEVAEVHWLTEPEVIEHVDAMPSNRGFVASLCFEETKTTLEPK